MVGRFVGVVAFVAVASCRPLLGIEDGVVAGDASLADGAVADDSDVDAVPIDAPMWWNPNFRFRHRVTIDTTKLTLPLAGFPLLVRVPSTITSMLVAGGNDIRFVDDSNTVLPFETDPSAVDAGTYWVKVSITQANPGLWLYYGDPNAQSMSSGARVFGAYVSVHHLSGVIDASGMTHTLTTNSSLTTASTMVGVVGNAKQFDGGDYFAASGAEADYDFTVQMSASAWINTSAFTIAYQAVITKGDTSWRMQRQDATSFMGFGSTSNAGNDNLSGDDVVTTGTWHHVAIVRDATTKKLYVDGALESFRLVGNAFSTNSAPVRIGSSSESPERAWVGGIDEVRITATDLSAAWIAAEYLTVTEQLVSIGAREAL